MTKFNILIEDEKFNHRYNNSSTSCKTEIDSVTKRKLYTDADFPAAIEGGQVALIKALQRGVNTDLTEEDSPFLDGKIVVAFIVETNGEITGERVVEDKTNRVGKEMLKVAKTLKWKPAICNKQKVPMLRSLYIIIDIAEG